MSENNEQAVSTGMTLPAGVTVTKRQTMVNMQPEERSVVTFGSPPRTIEVVDLDMGAQFDLAEVTGSIPGDNMEFRNLAYIAASVAEIDGFPAISAGGITKRYLRGILKKLGADGVRAAGAVIAGFAAAQAQTASEQAFKDTVGN